MKWRTCVMDAWYELRENMSEDFSVTICTVKNVNNLVKPRHRPWRVYGMGNTTRCFSTKERAMQAAELYFLEKELDK